MWLEVLIFEFQPPDTVAWKSNEIGKLYSIGNLFWIAEVQLQTDRIFIEADCVPGERLFWFFHLRQYSTLRFVWGQILPRIRFILPKQIKSDELVVRKFSISSYNHSFSKTYSNEASTVLLEQIKLKFRMFIKILAFSLSVGCTTIKPIKVNCIVWVSNRGCLVII